MKVKGFFVFSLVFVFVLFCFGSFTCAGDFDYSPKIKEAAELIEQGKNLIATGDDEVAKQVLLEAIDKIDGVLKKGKCTPADHYMIMVCYMRIKNLMPKGHYRKLWQEKAFKKAKYVAKLGPKWRKLLQDAWREYFVNKCKSDKCWEEDYLFMYSLGSDYLRDVVMPWINSKQVTSYKEFYPYALLDFAKFCNKHNMQGLVDKEIVPKFVRYYELSSLRERSDFQNLLTIAGKNNPMVAEKIREAFYFSKMPDFYTYARGVAILKILRSNQDLLWSKFDKDYLRNAIGEDAYKAITR